MDPTRYRVESHDLPGSDREELFQINFPGQPTVRETDGLACGSRNRLLTAAQRKEAAVIHRALLGARALVGSSWGQSLTCGQICSKR